MFHLSLLTNKFANTTSIWLHVDADGVGADQRHKSARHAPNSISPHPKRALRMMCAPTTYRNEDVGIYPYPREPYEATPTGRVSVAASLAPRRRKYVDLRLHTSLVPTPYTPHILHLRHTCLIYYLGHEITGLKPLSHLPCCRARNAPPLSFPPPPNTPIRRPATPAPP